MKNLFRSGNIEFKTSQMAFAESNKKTHMTHNLINVSKLAIFKYKCKTNSKNSTATMNLKKYYYFCNTEYHIKNISSGENVAMFLY